MAELTPEQVYVEGLIHSRMLLLLNELFERDPDAIRSLLQAHVPCNKALCEHPTCVVTDDDQVGMLGVLNGVFRDPSNRVATETEPGTDKVTGFVRYRRT